MYQIKMCVLFFLFLFMPLSSLTLALPTDQHEKVFIVAESTLYNFKTGVNIFEGHVKIDQGTSHITADRLITKTNEKHKIQEAIAYGTTELAHYWTLQKLNEPEIHARARVIKYYPIQSNVTLENDVIVTQGENSFKGQLIHYNSTDQTLIVPATKNGQAVLVYHPDKN